MIHTVLAARRDLNVFIGYLWPVRKKFGPPVDKLKQCGALLLVPAPRCVPLPADFFSPRRRGASFFLFCPRFFGERDATEKGRARAGSARAQWNPATGQ